MKDLLNLGLAHSPRYNKRTGLGEHRRRPERRELLSQALHDLHTENVILIMPKAGKLDGCYSKRCVYQTGCIRPPYQSHGKAWQGPSLQPRREHIAVRHTGLGRESALFDGRWLVWESPSSNNAIAALPTDVSVLA